VKRVHQTSDRTVAHLLRSALEVEAIPAVVEGEHLCALRGELPVGASAEYGVSILDDEQLPRATILVRQWLAADASVAGPSWVCRGCGERHEAHFLSCWKCGGETDPG
jgi:hypothetical protein